MAYGDGGTGQGVTTSAEQGYSVQELQELLSKARGVRSRFEPDFYLNTAFFFNHQWLKWSQAGRLDRPRLSDWRRTPVDNRILPVVSSRVARKTKTRPTFVCTPFSADEADTEAAEISEKVLDNDWQQMDLQASLYSAMLWADICGAGFWKIYWDRTKGEKNDFLFQNGQPFLQSNGQPVRADAFQELPPGMEARPVAQGDVCVDVLSPFEIYPDPLATSLAECEFLIEEKVRSPEYLRRRYDVTLEPDAPAPLGPVENRLYTSLVYSAQGSEEYKGVRTYEFWFRESTDYPNGKRCVMARDQILEEDEQPFDPMPYVMFTGVKGPGRFWPTAVTTALRGPQIELNKLLGQVQENAARMGNPAVLLSRQANVKWTGRPGEEVRFDSTVADAAPSFLQSPEMPAYIDNLFERIEHSITEISGMHEVSKGNVPTSVTAAAAINLLQEADDTRLGPEIQDMESQIGFAGTKILKLRARFNSDERIIRIAGEDGNWDIIKYRDQMLGKDPNVEVQAGSAMPHSKAAKQAAMMEVLALAFQYGIDFDARDLRKFFKDYEVGGLERLFAGLGADEMQTNREHRLMSQGIALNINDFDDHQHHQTAHQEFQKSEKYQRLPAPIQKIIATHTQAHTETLVQQVNQQMETQAREQEAQMQAEQEAALEQERLKQKGKSGANSR